MGVSAILCHDHGQSSGGWEERSGSYCADYISISDFSETCAIGGLVTSVVAPIDGHVPISV